MDADPPAMLAYDSSRGRSDNRAAGRAALWAGAIVAAATLLDRAAGLPRYFPSLDRLWPVGWAGSITLWSAAQFAVILASAWLLAGCIAALNRRRWAPNPTAPAALFLAAALLLAAAEWVPLYTSFLLGNFGRAPTLYAEIVAFGLLALLPVLLPAALVVATARRPAAGRAWVLASAAALGAASLARNAAAFVEAAQKPVNGGYGARGGSKAESAIYLGAFVVACIAAAGAVLAAWRASRPAGRRPAVLAAALLFASRTLVTAVSVATAAVTLGPDGFAEVYGPAWLAGLAGLLYAAAIPAAVVLAFRE